MLSLVMASVITISPQADVIEPRGFVVDDQEPFKRKRRSKGEKARNRKNRGW